VDAHNGGLEAQNGALEGADPWSQVPITLKRSYIWILIRIEVNCWIWTRIHIEVIAESGCGIIAEPQPGVGNEQLSPLPPPPPPLPVCLSVAKHLFVTQRE
jgi:hypothetical protein